jgi:hypothetical protein
MINKNSLDRFSKKQDTYGSEFVAAQICVEQIIDLQNNLPCLGDPIHSKSYMFGNYKTVVDVSMQV